MGVGGKVYVGTTLIATASLSDQYASPLTTDGVDTATSVRSTIAATASATPHTWGSWVEVDPSLSAAVNRTMLWVTNAMFSNGVNTSTLLQLGTGGAGAETAFATIGVGYAQTDRMHVIPGTIAAGTRVAMRVQSAVVSQAVSPVVGFSAAKDLNAAAPVSIGADTATSRGVTITAPGSLNTKGAWTELTASTSRAFTVLSLFPQGAGGTSFATGAAIIDIGIGGSGAETVLIPDVHLFVHSSELLNPRSPLAYGVDVPAGTRLSARYARSNANNPLDLVVVAS